MDTKQQAIVPCAWLFGRRKTRDCSTKCVTRSTTESPASGEAQRLYPWYYKRWAPSRSGG
jgi:hypothetical protein